jgi:ATP-dependent DNA ligase
MTGTEPFFLSSDARHAAARLGCRSAIIEGEVIVQDERGVSEFKALKSAIRCTPQRLVFCFVHCFAQ